MRTKIDLDIRHFRRYPKEAQFLLSFKTGLYEAKMIDYSLVGLGITINHLEVPLGKGDLVSFDINEPALYTLGKVAWTAKTTSGLRVGIIKAQPFKGRLNMYPLSDILISLHRTRKTGLLQIRDGTMDKRIFIKKGDMIFAESNYDKDRLGDVLLKKRKITKRQYDRVAEIKRKSGASYIAILLHMGYLSATDIKDARRLQARKIISGLFLMKDSEFEFIEGTLPREDEMLLSLPIADVIYRATKRNADIRLLEDHLLDKVVNFAPQPLKLFEKLEITTADKSILAKVNGKRSIRDIVELPGSHKAVHPLKTIYALLGTRFLKITDSVDYHGEVDYKLEKKKTDPFVDLIERLHSEYRQVDYYRILGVKTKDPAEKIKKAFFSAELKYHPAMHPLVDEDTKKKLHDIFAYIKNAYMILADSTRRMEYDLYIEETGGRQDMLQDSQPPLSPEQDDVQQNEFEANPSHCEMSADNGRKAKFSFRDGQVAFWDGNFKEAARLLRMAIEFDNSVPEYHYLYGRALGNLGKHKEAVHALNRANELKPLDPDTLAELGHLYLNLGFSVRAARYLNQATQIDPSNKKARECLKKLR